MEARHYGGPLGSRFQAPPPQVYSALPVGRSFRVRVGSTLSELLEQEMGVSQGSILSPALFSIKINNIVKAVLKGMDCSLFVDDSALCVSGKTLNRVERAMQLCVNIVQKWVSENGFRFSTSKTVCIHFHQQYVFCCFGVVVVVVFCFVFPFSSQTLTFFWEKRL